METKSKTTRRAPALKGDWLARVIPFLGLAFVIVFFTVVTGGRLLSASNLPNVVNSCFTIMLASVGAIFVYAHGGIDLSIGALQGLCITLSALVIAADIQNVWLAGLMCVGMGLASGCITGLLRAYLGVPAFIASIAVMYIWRGIMSTVILNNQVVFPAAYSSYDNPPAKLAVLIVTIVVGYILFEFTTIGKIQKAIGSNPVAVDCTGINTRFYIPLAHMFLGLCVGIGVIFTTPRYSIVTAAAGQGLEMDVLIAILIGGMSITGGAGSRLRCAVIGSATMALLNNGFAL